MDIVSFLTSLGVNAGAVIAIIFLVQLVKMLFGAGLAKLIPNKQTLGWIYLSAVAALSVVVALLTTLQLLTFNVWSFILSAIMYLVFSVGGYELFAFIFPALKAMIDKFGTPDQPAAPPAPPEAK